MFRHVVLRPAQTPTSPASPRRLPIASSELELRAAAADVVSSALTVLDRALIQQWKWMKIQYLHVALVAVRSLFGATFWHNNFGEAVTSWSMRCCSCVHFFPELVESSVCVVKFQRWTCALTWHDIANMTYRMSSLCRRPIWIGPYQDHRHFIRDLDSVWPTMKACKQLGSAEILTLTSALKAALACRLREIAQARSLPRRKVLVPCISQDKLFNLIIARLCRSNERALSRPAVFFQSHHYDHYVSFFQETWLLRCFMLHPRSSKALFNFMAELCWANYVSPSEHVIHQAIIHLLDTARTCISEGRSEPASWCLAQDVL